MHEALTLALTHVRMVWRFRWLALLVAAVVCLVGWSHVVLLPDTYRVTAKVFLDTRSMLRPLLRGIAANVDTGQSSVALIQRTLLVRSSLETIARQTDMDLKAKTPEQFDALLSSLKRRIRFSGTRKGNIFNLGFSDRDPQLAARVVETVLTLFVERSLGETRKDAGTTKQFLDKQIAEYEARLTASEDRLKEFKQRNVGILTGSQAGFFSRLQSAKGQISKARLQLKEATRRRDEFRRQVDEARAQGGSGGSGGVFGDEREHPLDSRITSLEQQLDQLYLKYTDRHPDAASTQAMIAELKAEREATPLPPLVEDPRIGLAMSQMDGEVAALTARVEEYERRAEELEKLVDTVPRIEAEMKRLDRDYNLYKGNYNQLVKRRESLKVAESANQASDSMEFRIIEPPRVPLKPTGPDRPGKSAVVLAMGVAAGLALAWVVAMLRPALYSREELEQLFKVHVIGTVTRSWTRAEVLRRRMEVVTFFVGCMVLGASFSGLVYVEKNNKDLLERVRTDQVVKSVARKVYSLL